MRTDLDATPNTHNEVAHGVHSTVTNNPDETTHAETTGVLKTRYRCEEVLVPRCEHEVEGVIHAEIFKERVEALVKV